MLVHIDSRGRGYSTVYQEVPCCGSSGKPGLSTDRPPSHEQAHVDHL